MRGFLSVAAAAALAVVGGLASVAPAQATVRAAPAVIADSAESGVQLVHKRRIYREPRYRYHSRHYYPRRHRYYSHYYYRPHVYYGYPRYYRRPGISLHFGFGGGHYGY